MSKYNIRMTIVTPTNMPNNRFVEFDFHKFVTADNLRKMLYKAANFEKDFTRIKHLNVEIKE